MRTKFLILFFLINAAPFSQELHWTSLNGPLGGIVGGLDIDSSENIFAGVYPFSNGYTGLYKSTNNGISWNKIASQFADFHVYSLFITKKNTIWVGTDGWGPNRLYCSTDDGLTWESKSNGYNSAECWAIGESNNGILFAGDADMGNLFRSTNNGDNWVHSANISPLTFTVDSSNTIYCGTFNGLYYSTDDGVSWIYNNSLGKYAVSSVIIDGNSNVYC